MKQHGFTLIELLLVIAVIGVLSSIAIPSFVEYNVKGFEARVTTDLRHAASAEEAYFSDYEAYKSCAGATCVTLLPGLEALSNGTSLQIVATVSGFSGTATHAKLAGATCLWNHSLGGFLGCS
ncbi:prepilin-type N-terminal cleavage/methylation domain-containing protein [Oligoflexia bacterium]|nr:prepilin-type N-terminal cleavage/methylation domain-containing protein [Oligoflexia bacterium]